MSGAESFAVVCPGPSLVGNSDIVRDPGGLVAVNTAMVWCRQKFIIPDFWIMADPEVLATCHEKVDLWPLAQKTVLWVPQNFANHAKRPTPGWCDWQPDLHRIYTRFDIVDYAQDITESMPFGRWIEWSGRSAFMGIAVALLCHAKRIRIYGCDMRGNEYYEPGLKNWRTNMTEKRWEWERGWMRQIINVCADNNVEVILV